MFRGAICSCPTLTHVLPRLSEAEQRPPGLSCGAQGVAERLARAVCWSRPCPLLSPGLVGGNGTRGKGKGKGSGWHGAEGTQQSSLQGLRDPPPRQPLAGMGLTDHSGLGVRERTRSPPSSQGISVCRLQACAWPPGYRPHVPAPGPSPWAGPASMGEDGGRRTEPPPAAASTDPKGHPGRGEGFADGHAGQRVVT